MSKKRIPGRQRQIVTRRAQHCCEYCRISADFATQSFCVEHIIPLHHGGEDSFDNLALACPGCNAHKYTKIDAPDPIDGVITPLYHPRKHRWSDHFQWSDDSMRIVGITPTGRATVEALKMNRQSLVNLRQALYALGEHPPIIPDAIQ